MGVLGAIRGLVRSPEDLASTALVHVLGESLRARKAFNGLLQLPNDTMWQSQYGLSDEGQGAARPDLAGVSGGSVVAFVEAKFDAVLTQAQPVAYLRRLDSNGLLAFLVPLTRVDYIGAESQRRTASEGFTNSGNRVEFTSTEGAVLRRVRMVTWDEVVGHLIEATNHPDSRPHHDDLVQIRDLVQQIQSQLYVPLTSEQLTDSLVPRVTAQIIDLLQGLRDYLSAEGFEQQGNHASTVSGWQGITLRRPGAPLRWTINMDMSSWRRFAPTPFWLTLGWKEQLTHAQLLEPWVREVPPRGYRLDTPTYSGNPVGVPLLLDGGEDRSEALHRLGSQVITTTDHASELLASSGG